MEEIGEQSFDGLERIRLLSVAKVAVIALACLIVVPKHAFVVDHKGKTILVEVLRPPDWLGYPPDHQLNERTVFEFGEGVQDQRSLHVGQNTNMSGQMSKQATLSSVFGASS
jgi:hypothetical protein